VLDPFAGSGTVGAAAVKADRRFVLFDINPDYVNLMREQARKWLGPIAKNTLCVNCAPITQNQPYLPTEDVA
jgi:DNA modification methylase